jgi:hypothetical protein
MTNFKNSGKIEDGSKWLDQLETTDPAGGPLAYATTEMCKQQLCGA